MLILGLILPAFCIPLYIAAIVVVVISLLVGILGVIYALVGGNPVAFGIVMLVIMAQAVKMLCACLFASIMLSMIFFSHNMVHILLWVIMFFITGSLSLLAMGHVYIALLFFIVYVGGISFLFLFVVMSLPTKQTFEEGFGSAVSFIAISIVATIFILSYSHLHIYSNLEINYIPLDFSEKTSYFDIKKIGALIYSSKYAYTFLFFVIFLLLSMLVSIDISNYRRSYVLTDIQEAQTFRDHAFLSSTVITKKNAYTKKNSRTKILRSSAN